MLGEVPERSEGDEGLMNEEPLTCLEAISRRQPRIHSDGGSLLGQLRSPFVLPPSPGQRPFDPPEMGG